MRALVVYESMFGNTQVVARAIVEGLSRHMAADLVEVGSAPALSEDLELLVVGGPTHAFGMSKPSTRQDAATKTDHQLVSTGVGLQEWLASLPRGTHGTVVATFDTRVNKPRLPGSAAARAHRRLRRLGYGTVARPHSFYVNGMTGPLVEGEEGRAYAWGEQLAAITMAGQLNRQDG